MSLELYREAETPQEYTAEDGRLIAVPTRRLLATNFSVSDFRKEGWTDQEMYSEGYLSIIPASDLRSFCRQCAH